MNDLHATDDARAWRTAVVVTAAAAVVRLLFAAVIPLFPDETYYWEWSRRLAGGYFDHPPMIAVLIRIGTALVALGGGGPSPLAVRFVPVLAGALASLAAAAIARRIGGGAAARTAAVVLAVMPLAAAGLVLATPDAPLLAASAVGLYGVTRALQSPARSRASLLWWSAAGAALGAAFASKYTSILLPLAITAAVVLRPSLRARLREPGPYVACVLATLVFLPVLRWNAAHDWISFRFQLQHGLGAPRGSAVKRELDLVAGQLGLVSPILFVLMARAVWRSARRDDVRFALAIVAVASWVFFAYSALRRPVEANWPAPSYLPGVALLAALVPTSPAHERWLRRGVALAATLSGLLLALVVWVASGATVPAVASRALARPARELASWRTVAARVAEAGGGTRYWVGADRYQDVSKLAHELPGRPVAFCTCLAGRRNQYELWPGFAATAAPGDALVLVLDERPAMHESVAALAPYFARATRGALAPLLRGTDTVGVRRLWVLEGYRGGWPSRAAP